LFGLSWDRIILILLVALFVIGPERIPTAVSWVMQSLRKVRSMAAGAQAELRSQIGPELEELRRQVAELQSLKEIGELRALRELNPRTIIGKNILGDEFSGGVTGFLGLNGKGPDDTGSNGNGAAGGAVTANGAGQNGAAANGAAHGPAGGATAASNGAASGDGKPGGATAVLTAPRPQSTLPQGQPPPFDDEGT
jgi:sec-independent protein translocase protein TatB